MTKLETVLKINIIPIVESILIGNKGKPDEYYIDSRTKVNEKNMPIVKPIAENEKFIWYICPFCQKIHIESKRCLNVNNKILWANCKYRCRISQYITLDCESEPLAHQKVTDKELEHEWNYMQKFENKEG